MFFLTILIGLSIAAIFWFSGKFITWHPLARGTKFYSKLVNRPRLPGERLSVWTKRVDLAMKELDEAADAFLEAAYKDGWMEHDGTRVVHWCLPGDHPAAVRYAKAKGLIP